LNITDNNFGETETARTIIECLQNNKTIAELCADKFESLEDESLKISLFQLPAFVAH